MEEPAVSVYLSSKWIKWYSMNIHKTDETSISCFTLKRFENIRDIDDTYIKESTFCVWIKCSATVKLFTDMGLALNMAKSVFIPSPFITFLGFILNSVHMTLSLTSAKAVKLKSKGTYLRNNQFPTIWTVSEVIGLMGASFPGIQATWNRKSSRSHRNLRQFSSHHEALIHGKMLPSVLDWQYNYHITHCHPQKPSSSNLFRCISYWLGSRS